MDRNKLKTYAPEARRDFIQAVTDKAAFYGFTADDIEPMTEEGDVALIGGRPFPKVVGAKRKKLEARIRKQGFEQTMEAMAYTWFNRLVAIRYMELHEYLDHGYRVLSHTEGHNLPEIVEHAEHVDLPGLDSQNVVELKLDGTKEEELFRMLLIAQCNALHKAMPFLFESIDDDTELLLPDNLLHSDSLIRNLVTEIDEDDWQQVEIIGWLYQFYISEKKDEVIGKVVKSEDIPAATQLFTPNWIVKYLVQNSLGRQWMATYPTSPLKSQMEYYIAPAEQTPEVHAELDEITPDSLNPEDLTLLDPACGSGHILVEAYDLLKAIYQERGYRTKDIPGLILEKNLFGLEIDDRAAQLAAFALMMKGRADDRSILERSVQPHVLSIQESADLDAKEITDALNAPLDRGDVTAGDILQTDVAHIVELFEHGKTYGSLIHVPEDLGERLPTLRNRVEALISHGGLLERPMATAMKPFVDQATALVRSYDAVVANPPYMGGRNGMNPALKQFASKHFPTTKYDLFSMFIERGIDLTTSRGVIGMVTMESWMFLSSYESFRQHVLHKHTILCLGHFPYDGRSPTAMGINFGVSATCIQKTKVQDYTGHYCCARHYELTADGMPQSFPPANERLAIVASEEFDHIPGSPVSYWVSDRVRRIFSSNTSLGDVAVPRQGMATSDNDRFMRRWSEVSIQRIGFESDGRSAAKESGCKWFPYNKGGEYRKWYGNNEFVVNWGDDGREVLEYAAQLYGSPTRTVKNIQHYFRPGSTWSQTGSGATSFRHVPKGFIFAHIGSMVFDQNGTDGLNILGFLNSSVALYLLKLSSQSLGLEVGHIRKLPIAVLDYDVSRIRRLISITASDWDTCEISWDFTRFRLLEDETNNSSIDRAFSQWRQRCTDNALEVKQLEEENNRYFIEVYGLEDELTEDVPIKQITLTSNPFYHYRDGLSEEEQNSLVRCDVSKDLVSYVVGCMMGRYSLDEPGLIFANSSNEGFDQSKYRKFPADEDGIVPLTEFSWFEDDAAHRFDKFIAAAWPAEHLQENLTFVAESLGPKKGETPRDTIRRYLATGFYKHHLSLYKKRPIYWLFSSGKQRGFQALVYLHRYNEGTLARMRTEYVIPLLGKMAARIDQLTDDIADATSTPHQKRMEKEKATITKQLAEVQSFDEKLRHFADQRIALDLDDGVKVNYGKFGDLLAEVKAVTGKKPTG